uniref:Uncharacterized protein n=1 Tax=Plectus sambesii TaxID=2011161 RepID=A0A914XDB3_9BILA
MRLMVRLRHKPPPDSQREWPFKVANCGLTQSSRLCHDSTAVVNQWSFFLSARRMVSGDAGGRIVDGGREGPLAGIACLVSRTTIGGRDAQRRRRPATADYASVCATRERRHVGTAVRHKCVGLCNKVVGRPFLVSLLIRITRKSIDCPQSAPAARHTDAAPLSCACATPEVCASRLD